MRKAISLEPTYAEAYNEMGYALHQLNRYPEAVLAYQSAIRHKTDYASAHYNLGVSFCRAAQPKRRTRPIPHIATNRQYPGDQTVQPNQVVDLD